MDRKSIFWGIFLIAVGLIFLANNLNILNIDWYYIVSNIWQLWPLLMVVGGLAFWVGWLNNRKEYGLIMPGTILATYGLLFWHCTYHGWQQMAEYNLWAFFLIGPGLGFFLMYLMGQREKGLLIPGSLLLGLGIVFLTGPENIALVWPIVLIAIGVGLLFKHRENQRRKADSAPTDSNISVNE